MLKIRRKLADLLDWIGKYIRSGHGHSIRFAIQFCHLQCNMEIGETIYIFYSVHSFGCYKVHTWWHKSVAISQWLVYTFDDAINECEETDDDGQHHNHNNNKWIHINRMVFMVESVHFVFVDVLVFFCVILNANVCLLQQRPVFILAG